MKFVPINQHYEESDCKHYRVSSAKDPKARDGLVFTLTSAGEILGQERCANVASERTQARRELHAFAAEHARQGLTTQGEQQ